MIGVLWGSVHLALALPGMVYAGTPWLATILELVGLSVLITWLYVQTGGKVYLGVSLIVVLANGSDLKHRSKM